MKDFVASITEYIWSPYLVCLCIFAGVYFSFLTRFVQIRHFKEMIVLLFSKKDNKNNGTSSFQSFCIALSGKVGTGNIVGVATAIAFGGPGAIVWMWIIAVFGVATAFAESTLSQIYKESHKNDYYGGPAFYIEKGLNCKPLAVIFAIITGFSSLFLLIPVQINGICVSLNSSFGFPMLVMGCVIALLIGIIIIGGIKRIASVAQVVCPIMAIGYIILSVIILIINIDLLPSAFMDMIRSAIGINPVLSGILGSTILWGVKRGIYSNEAGQGSGAIVSGSASVSHPVKQGLTQSFSIYVDTLLICTATALIILSCKTYNVFSSDMEMLLSNPNAPSGEPGVLYTTAAIGTVINYVFANVTVSTALFFFAFTTILAYCYYSESNLFFLYRFFPSAIRYEKKILLFFRILLIVSIILGSILNPLYTWMLGDIGVGLMAWINIITIIILSPLVYRSLKDYEQQIKSGVNPIFDPKKLGIKNADFWENN